MVRKVTMPALTSVAIVDPRTEIWKKLHISIDASRRATCVSMHPKQKPPSGLPQSQATVESEQMGKDAKRQVPAERVSGEQRRAS
jgi:hypothetical protein